MDIFESLEQTANELKFDYDEKNMPQWFILTHLINIMSTYPDAILTRSSSGSGYHIYIPTQKSNIDIRRLHREDKGRLFCSESRARALSISISHDVIYRRKGSFRIIEHKNRRPTFIWTRKPKGDSEPLTLKDLLMLPFCSQIDFHRKNRIRWYKKHFLPRLKEIDREARKNAKFAYAFK
jgi:hypothetical protein